MKRQRFEFNRYKTTRARLGTHDGNEIVVDRYERVSRRTVRTPNRFKTAVRTTTESETKFGQVTAEALSVGRARGSGFALYRY